MSLPDIATVWDQRQRPWTCAVPAPALARGNLPLTWAQPCSEAHGVRPQSEAAAFLVGSAKHGTQPVAALESAAEAGAGTLANPLGTLNRLKLLLSSLGIPVNHLIEGSQKCVAELGPEAMGAVKALRALLGALTMFG
ncbi:secretoglobin family 3A member 1 isoform X1 [Pongo abelii]|uniref:Secretoglobin family 3A member 1 n=1 Tax=Pongo abelii TaxID=9601 RepID=A0A8I5U129_PONAB|nr:secretoglobin family 3A member 1 isoform X1 [Pongo abelii]